jgi:cytochrome c oxidase subunit 3
MAADAGAHAAVAPLLLHASTDEVQETGADAANPMEHATTDKAPADKADHDHHDQADLGHVEGEDPSDHSAPDGANAADDFGGYQHHEKLDRDIGIFFSIYYCMTGLHAIHIIGGIVALSWVYWRSLLGHWRNDYFGPVDFVGLYWHLVDLIWIYLFPLLYLID